MNESYGAFFLERNQISINSTHRGQGAVRIGQEEAEQMMSCVWSQQVLE